MKECGIDKKLFFVVGCGRSGTTLLKTILNEHENVAVTPETFFYDSVVAKEKTKDLDLNGKVEKLFSKWWIKDFGLNKSDVINNLNSIKCDDEWDAVFLSFIKSYADKHKVDCVGEKTPRHIAKAEYFIKSFPGVKVVNIIRDPRAVYSSYRKTKVGTISVANVINEWKNAYSVHVKLEKSASYYCIRYEDLVNSPEDVIKNILEFIGVPFDPSVLTFYQRSGAGYSPEQRHHGNTFKPIFNASVDEWQKCLNRYQKSLIENRLYNEMKSVGYDCATKPTPLLDVYYYVSTFFDYLHKLTIRKPRQLIKAYKASKRHEKSMLG